MNLTAKQTAMMDRHNGTARNHESALSAEERAEWLSLFDRSDSRQFSRSDRAHMVELERRMRRSR